MKNLMKRFKENNKGFTLVELIVVIAVLAVITVVAAPQYLQYVEKSRIGVDENALGEIAHIAEISYVELISDSNTTNNDTVLEFSITNGVLAYSTAATNKALEESVAVIMPATQYTFKSDEYKNGTGTITITSGGSASATNGKPFAWTKAATPSPSPTPAS